MSEVIAICSLVLNFILVCCVVVAGRAAWIHFRGGAVLDWLSHFNTREFFESDEIVCSLVDEKDPSTLVDRINERPENRIAVTHVLSSATHAATAAKLKLMHRRSLMRYTVFIIPYYWEKLSPWIEARRKYRGEPYLYADLEWLANEIKRNRDALFTELRRKGMHPLTRHQNEIEQQNNMNRERP